MMDISSNTQLVPYNQEPRYVVQYWPRKIGSGSADRHPAAQQNILMPPPPSPGYKIQARDLASIYNSNCQFKAQEINPVGLLIDIYA